MNWQAREDITVCSMCQVGNKINTYIMGMCIMFMVIILDSKLQYAVFYTYLLVFYYSSNNNYLMFII